MDNQKDNNTREDKEKELIKAEFNAYGELQKALNALLATYDDEESKEWRNMKRLRNRWSIWKKKNMK